MTQNVPQGRCIWHVYRRFSIISFAKMMKMMKSHILMESMKMKMGGSGHMMSTLMSVMISLTARIQWCTGRNVNHQTGLKGRMGTLRRRKKPQRMRVLRKMKGSQRTRTRVTSNSQGVTRTFPFSSSY
jgi:hypothetical protein